MSRLSPPNHIKDEQKLISDRLFWGVKLRWHLHLLAILMLTWHRRTGGEMGDLGMVWGKMWGDFGFAPAGQVFRDVSGKHHGVEAQKSPGFEAVLLQRCVHPIFTSISGGYCQWKF